MCCAAGFGPPIVLKKVDRAIADGRRVDHLGLPLLRQDPHVYIVRFPHREVNCACISNVTSHTLHPVSAQLFSDVFRASMATGNIAATDLIQRCSRMSALNLQDVAVWLGTQTIHEWGEEQFANQGMVDWNSLVYATTAYMQAYQSMMVRTFQFSEHPAAAGPTL